MHYTLVFAARSTVVELVEETEGVAEVVGHMARYDMTSGILCCTRLSGMLRVFVIGFFLSRCKRSKGMREQQQGRDAVVRVLVVDDQQLMREGIASLLRIHDVIETIGTAANGNEALERAVSMQPDLILMDVRMPVMD